MPAPFNTPDKQKQLLSLLNELSTTPWRIEQTPGAVRDLFGQFIELDQLYFVRRVGSVELVLSQTSMDKFRHVLFAAPNKFSSYTSVATMSPEPVPSLPSFREDLYRDKLLTHNGMVTRLNGFIENRNHHWNEVVAAGLYKDFSGYRVIQGIYRDLFGQSITRGSYFSQRCAVAGDDRRMLSLQSMERVLLALFYGNPHLEVASFV